MHLERTIAPSEGNRPFAVSEKLDFVVARRLDVELDEDVLVVADAERLHLAQNFPNHGRCLLGAVDDALPFATAAADCLETNSAAPVFLEDLRNFDLDLLGELVDRVKVDVGIVGSPQERVGQGFEIDRFVTELGNIETMLLGELGECFAVGMVPENQPRRGVVGARRHADVDALGGALGLVLEARRLNRVASRGR